MRVLTQTPPLSLLGVEVGAGVDTLITRLRTVGGTNPGVREVLQVCVGPLAARCRCPPRMRFALLVFQQPECSGSPLCFRSFPFSPTVRPHLCCMQCMGPRPVPGAAEADGADARERTQTYLERLSFWTVRAPSAPR
eukprot:365187-Chlamydomonas_euryale.AAC.20